MHNGSVQAWTPFHDLCCLQKVAVTTTLPEKVPPTLHTSEAGPHEWIYDGNSVWHNRTEITRGTESSRKNTVNIGILLLPNGELHIYWNGEHKMKGATHLPVDKPLWGVVDVYGDTVTVEAELLSGKC